MNCIQYSICFFLLCTAEDELWNQLYKMISTAIFFYLQTDCINDSIKKWAQVFFFIGRNYQQLFACNRLHNRYGFWKEYSLRTALYYLIKFLWKWAYNCILYIAYFYIRKRKKKQKLVLLKNIFLQRMYFNDYKTFTD